MKLLNTKIAGPKIIQTEIHSDKRGFLKEVYKQKLIKKDKFIFELMSFSKKNVLRGLHIQTKKMQAKIITVAHGEIFDVAVDLRRKSKNFGKYFSINLSDKNGLSIYIPPGFAHGFLALKKNNIITYNCTNYRSEKHELGIKWSDKDINIKWPVKKPIISNKDQNNMSLVEYLKIYE